MSHDWIALLTRFLRQQGAPVQWEITFDAEEEKRRFLAGERFLDWCYLEHKDPESTESMVEFEQWWLDTYGEGDL